MLGQRRMAMHWHMHHDGAAHWRSWKARGRPMPVAIALGGESVLPYAATCPLPPGISELLMAGYLQGRGIEMCRGVTVPIWVPANAEIVIEGFVSHEAGSIGWDPRDPDAGPLGPGAVFEGPFGDHTGFYSLPDRYPILEVTAITHRRDPIYPTTIVGLPPQEDYYLGKATERIMRPLLKTIMPDVADYDLPMFGAFHNAAAMAIDKHYPLHARRVMHGVWGAGQMSWTKNVFVVDHDVDLHDSNAVLRAAAERCNPEFDIERVRGPLDILDHAAPRLGAGTKIGFDCTRPIRDEHPDDAGAAWKAPDDAGADELLAAIRSVRGVRDAALPASLGRGWLLVSIEKSRAGDGARAIDEIERTGGSRLPPFVIVLGPDVSVKAADTDLALFHWCAHTDAGRDAVVFHVRNAEGARRAVMAFDATPKVPGDERHGHPVRPWPPILSFPPAIRERIAARWTELGLGAGSPT
jgi:4-hydroxy-3-polyprenylbenzoate decarboxylase